MVCPISKLSFLVASILRHIQVCEDQVKMLKAPSSSPNRKEEEMFLLIFVTFFPFYRVDPGSCEGCCSILLTLMFVK